MKLHKKTLVILSVLLLLIGTVGGTIAYLTMETQPVSNVFTPGSVGGDIQEEFDNNVKSNIKVANSGNTKAYFRIKLISYWYALNADSIIAKDSWFDINEWSSKADNGWFYVDGYFYYPEPVEPTQATAVLFEEDITLEKDAIGRQVLEILADAIQAIPDDAVEEAWSAVDVDPTSGKLVIAATSP